MKVYLDIDGTLIHEDLDRIGQPAVGLPEFIQALRPCDVYWLTTHCKDGDAAQAAAIVKRVLPEELHADIDKIRPTTWAEKKTEALDFSDDFIWFDNDIFDDEWEALKACGPEQSAVQVDLVHNPEQLTEIVRDIL